jgi:hypothetical protein
MIRPAWWLLLVCTIVVLWQECGENLSIFCYRIGWAMFSKLRTRALFLVPVPVRSQAACWKLSFTSFGRSTTPKGSNS